MLLLAFCLVAAGSVSAEVFITESFEFGNHDLASPVGWVCNDDSWLCGHYDKDHNRSAYDGEWYVFTNADDSWMFMPVDMVQGIHYLISCWAVTDGAYQFEVKYGDAPTPEAMTTDCISATSLNSGDYQELSSYFACDTSGTKYIGFHGVAGAEAWYLTIDNFVLEMVQQYDFLTQAVSLDTIMYPGDDGNFKFRVTNTGYDTETLVISASHEFFPTSTFYIDGEALTTFSIDPSEVKIIEVAATLSDTVEPNSTCWLDVMVHSTHNCHTGLATFWVVPQSTVMEFPVYQTFNNENTIISDWMVFGGGKPSWKWGTTGDTPPCQPYEGEGMAVFNSASGVSGSSSLLLSKKLALNATNNLVRFHVYRNSGMPEKADRINVYYNTKASVEDAQLLVTIHRCTTLSPAVSDEGWYEYNLNFDANPSTGFIIFEAVSEEGQNIYLDDVTIDNTPLELEEEHVALQLYPNPTSSAMHIGNVDPVTVSIYDMNGKVVMQSHDKSIDLNGLKAGAYVVEVVTKDGKITKTVIRK